MVDEGSARLGKDNETAVGLVGRNHTTVCKFESETDPCYGQVFSQLHSAIVKARTPQGERELEARMARLLELTPPTALPGVAAF